MEYRRLYNACVIVVFECCFTGTFLQCSFVNVMLKILAKALMLKSDIAEEGWELPGNYP